jgi:hypothetical protein
VTEQNQIRQTETSSADPHGHTGGSSVSRRTEREINPYLYENLVSNLECQISSWVRKADRESNSDIAQALRSKAEGLGYALRLLFVFKPDFEELVAEAGTLKCQGCGTVLKHDGCRQATDSIVCDACYEIGRDEENFIAENHGAFWRPAPTLAERR